MIVLKHAAVMAMASLCTREQGTVERLLYHLTPPALEKLKQQLQEEVASSLRHHSDHVPSEDDVTEKDVYEILAVGCLRCTAYRCLHKYESIASSETVETALKFHTLPKQIQKELMKRYGGTAPTTWFDALEQLKERVEETKNQSSDNNLAELWRLILDHPITAYVPVQCQSCGHVIPDDAHCNTPQDDAKVGLKELEPTGEELQLRGGWFRGPRGPKVFQLTCPSCRHVSHWYRSGHPKVILNPCNWGRLCGEQEELRLSLASFIGIPLRSIVPLDWDHIWSEYSSSSNTTTTTTTSSSWQVQDDSARNFACRLDEGIGAWAGVLAIHPNPAFCQDVTDSYLACREDDQGRADHQHKSHMNRYRETVFQARRDASGETTQTKTLNGFLLQQAGMTAKDITEVLGQASRDYSANKPWWEML
eukprot:scaffold34637_cov187-Amphora_coffeaeformis.AAC.5